MDDPADRGNGIKRAVENAMEDLAGLSEPADDAHVPDPGNPDDDVQVHSSISEGSNAMDSDEARLAGDGGLGSAGATGTDSGTDTGTDSEPRTDPDENPAGHPTESPSVNPPQNPVAEPGDFPLDNPQSVPGPGGLPETDDPRSLAGDPGESHEDPSTNMGRG
ncbi:hypothetical protein [Arthrobacter sp. ISL-30]|uniref:hypothetical protein n=1 Tax=Arthrobacter sp. ISL-30 TaxID=2819109 RepID=UPI001BEBF210|nr:hypothetical protein [Arthrobacter sp. ISL-30]MBT2513828.1 hypothetical protein [Arthrobacter sp. ISL-30]